jgi:hypothetical protein
MATSSARTTNGSPSRRFATVFLMNPVIRG